MTVQTPLATHGCAKANQELVYRLKYAGVPCSGRGALGPWIADDVRVVEIIESGCVVDACSWVTGWPSQWNRTVVVVLVRAAGEVRVVERPLTVEGMCEMMGGVRQPALDAAIPALR